MKGLGVGKDAVGAGENPTKIVLGAGGKERDGTMFRVRECLNFSGEGGTVRNRVREV